MARPKRTPAAEPTKYPLHAHCGNCGACLNTGTIHRCGGPIRADIAEVMRDDTNRVMYSRRDPELQRWIDENERLQATA